MALDANTEYEVDRAKKLLDSYLAEFGEHDQGDNRVYLASEILGRLMKPKVEKKKMPEKPSANDTKCHAASSTDEGWTCDCGLPNPSSCLRAAGVSNG